MSRGRHLLPTEHTRLMTSCKLREVLLDLDAEIPLRIFSRARLGEWSKESAPAGPRSVPYRWAPSGAAVLAEARFHAHFGVVAPAVEADGAGVDELIPIVALEALDEGTHLSTSHVVTSR